MNILESQQKILEFCAIPRTSNELAAILNLNKSEVYLLIKNLMRSKKLIKKGDDKRRANPALFIRAVDAPVVVAVDDNTTNNFHAHNPFGLKL
jgi:hypothetical protein